MIKIRGKDSVNINVGSNNSGESLFLTLLLVLFIGLKLTGVIHWSWWWVFSPVWIPFSVVLGVILIVVIAEVIRR